jgi:drug/metabolite transporter (DMT)-like permease
MTSIAKLHAEAPTASSASASTPRGVAAREQAMFGVLCFVWGTTWLAMKVGIATVPPGFFAGTRWTVAGLALLLIRALGGHTLAVPFRLRARLVLCSVLMVSLNQVIQLYGLRHITAGLAAVLSSALTPIGLLGFAVALRQEKFRWQQVGAVALGVAGILVLFGPKALKGELDVMEVLGALAVVVSTLSYAAGSVLARPLMRTMPPAHVAAMTNFIGGGLLLGFALAFEPGALTATTGNWGWPAFLAWLYLLLPGSLGATVIYFLLVRDWGASRAGTYAFISPVIAVVIGLAFFGEQVEAADVLGMILMLSAAGMVLRLKR